MPQWRISLSSRSIQGNGNPALAIVEASQLAAEGAITANTLIDETKRAATVDFTVSLFLQMPCLPHSEQALKDVRLIGALLIGRRSHRHQRRDPRLYC